LRLHPFTVAEIHAKTLSDVTTLLKLGGFPEPFLRGDARAARRWSLQYRERLVRDEVPKLERIDDLASLELLTHRLPALVGSPLSINNLREDLEKAFKTVKNWLFVLEKLYHTFPVAPLGGSTLRAVKKERKFYLYDWSLIEDEGFRFENMVGSHLLKWVHYQYDIEGMAWALQYFRDRDGREVDFVLTQNEVPKILIECKLTETQPSDSLLHLKRRFPKARAIQLVFNPRNEKIHPSSGIEVISALRYLQTLV
jgi:predicted AAA+ superfamily ATPase